MRFRVDQLLRADAAARWAVYTQADAIGAITTDEIRAFEFWEPLTPEQKREIAASKATVTATVDPQGGQQDGTQDDPADDPAA